MKYLPFLLLFFVFRGASAQNGSMPLGKVFRISSTNAMFPDSLRNKEPRVYGGKTYTAAEHYNDSSVYIFVPSNFNAAKPYHFVFWFHGWSNNIDSALVQYHLQEQFFAAQKNAIFVFPEGPKNSPDSYGGKFEQPDVFNRLMKEMLGFLAGEKVIKADNHSFDMVYAGHSGAYRVISYLLLRSSYTPKAVFLFDALYGEQEKFMQCLENNPACRMINIYTDSGGTYQNSKNFAVDMEKRKWKYIDKEEDDCTNVDMRDNRIIFLHSKKKHNDVVANHNNFERFLEILD